MHLVLWNVPNSDKLLVYYKKVLSKEKSILYSIKYKRKTQKIFSYAHIIGSTVVYMSNTSYENFK